MILNVLVETTGKTCAIPFFILDSSQPLWRGELMDCGLLFGTNALVEYGFRVTHSDGTSVEPTPKNVSEQGSSNVINVLHVSLGETLHLKPHQTKWAKAVVDVQGDVTGTWMMKPNEEQLATQQCKPYWKMSPP